MPKANIKAEIDSLTKELEKLDARKCCLENAARKLLKEIAQLTDQIDSVECEAERGLRDKLERECRERIQCGIERLKKEQKSAQEILCRYEQNLRLKFKMMKGCQHDKQICQCSGKNCHGNETGGDTCAEDNEEESGGSEGENACGSDAGNTDDE